METPMSDTDHFQGVQDFVIRPATLDDLPAAVDFLNLYTMATIGVKEYDLDYLHRQWTMPGYDLDASTRVVLTKQGEWIGYVDIWDLDDPPVRVHVWGAVHPEYQRQGIGTQLQAWAEDRARQALTRLPDDVRATIRMTCPSTNEAPSNLFKKRGAKLARRYWDMQIDLTGPLKEPIFPDGLRLITFDEFNDLEAVYRADDEAFQDHWGYVEESFEVAFPKWKHWMTSPDTFDPTLWYLAMDGEQLAGLAINRDSSNEDPDMGWVRALAVRRPWRKQGLGLALLLHSFAELKRRGKLRAGLGVDSGSLTGATRLYEKAGMHVHRVYDSYEIEMRPGRELARTSIDE
jgi:GNAT superfamily N-acetyltransferase